MSISRPVCPLCGSQHYGASWLGSTHYADRRFEYLRCNACGSLYCHPMPDQDISSRLYGMDYAAFSGSQRDHPDTRLTSALDVLAKRPPGRLIDYGCGDGSFLRAAAKLGWQCEGVEFSPEVVRDLSTAMGLPVVDANNLHALTGRADVVALNDVIEHFSDLPSSFAAVLRLLKPSGLIIAQGPLEANSNLFTHTVALHRRTRRATSATMPPYHVLLATARGQRMFFRRVGLRELRFSVIEAAWPAPARLTRSVIGDSRALGLFLLRRVSRITGAVLPSYSGNRYLYVGAPQ
jgi:SAM-dependent methyltransferase